VLIADDHGLVRAGLRSLLSTEPDITVVGEAADGAETLELATRLQPDVVLADISMPAPDGIEVARRLKAEMACCRTLIVSMHEDPNMLRDALAAGAAGYLVKRAIEPELSRAIRTVAAGQPYIHEVMQPYLEPAPPGKATPEAPAEGAADLSTAEVKMLQMLAKGATMQRVAQVLGITDEQARQLRQAVTERLGLSSRVAIVKYAQQHLEGRG
jgi:DNA-binding NarL/FixJ family response regulator